MQQAAVSWRFSPTPLTCSVLISSTSIASAGTAARSFFSVSSTSAMEPYLEEGGVMGGRGQVSTCTRQDTVNSSSNICTCQLRVQLSAAASSVAEHHL